MKKRRIVVAAAAALAAALGALAIAAVRADDSTTASGRRAIELVGTDVIGGGVNVRTRISNWKLYSEMGRRFPDGGHWHVLADDGEPVGGSADGTTTYVEGLGPGTHRLYVELFNNDDTPLEPPARSRTVTVEIPKEES